jgi:hypothetical protein
MLADAPTDEAPVRKAAPRITRVIEEPATAQPSTARKRWAAHHDRTDKAAAVAPKAKKHWASARANHRQLAASHKVHSKHKAVRTARAHHQQYARAQQPYFFFFPTWR